MPSLPVSRELPTLVTWACWRGSDPADRVSLSFDVTAGPRKIRLDAASVENILPGCSCNVVRDSSVVSASVGQFVLVIDPGAENRNKSKC